MQNYLIGTALCTDRMLFNFPVGKCVCAGPHACVGVCMHAYMRVSMVGGWLVGE